MVSVGTPLIGMTDNHIGENQFINKLLVSLHLLNMCMISTDKDLSLRIENVAIYIGVSTKL